MNAAGCKTRTALVLDIEHDEPPFVDQGTLRGAAIRALAARLENKSYPEAVRVLMGARQLPPSLQTYITQVGGVEVSRTFNGRQIC